MLRRLTCLAVAAILAAVAAPAYATIWPDRIGPFQNTGSKPLAVSDKALWDEYGLEAAEQADYQGKTSFHAEAWRLKDPTGAYAAFEWQRPADAKPSKLTPVAAETADAVVAAYGNYLFRFTGYKPTTEELDVVLEHVPRLNQGELPNIHKYLPEKGLQANSERYILGPVSLEAFDPGVPPSVAAFHLGAEAELGRYGTPKGEMTIAVFSYPTPQIARQRVAEFRKLPNAMPKWTGPLVALATSPPDADAAERLLAGIKYQGSIVLNERVPTRRDNLGDLIINIFLLIGILLGLFVIAGILFGFGRRWIRGGKEEEAMVVLHLHDR